LDSPSLTKGLTLEASLSFSILYCGQLTLSTQLTNSNSPQRPIGWKLSRASISQTIIFRLLLFPNWRRVSNFSSGNVYYKRWNKLHNYKLLPPVTSTSVIRMLAVRAYLILCIWNSPHSVKARLHRVLPCGSNCKTLAIEQNFFVVFFLCYTMRFNFSMWGCVRLATQMEVIELYSRMVLFDLLYKVILSFESVDEILKGNHSESPSNTSWCPVVCYATKCAWLYVLRNSKTKSFITNERHWLVQSYSLMSEWKKSLSMAIQMKVVEQCFPLMQFIMLYHEALTLSLPL